MEEWRNIGLAAPACRALVNAGITKIQQLSKWTRSDIAALHGMGPNALSKIEKEMLRQGITFKSA